MRVNVITEQELDALVKQIESLTEVVSSLSSNPHHIIYDTKDFQEKLGVSERTQQNWRNLGVISFSKVQGTIFYRMSDIQEMLDNHKVSAQ